MIFFGSENLILDLKKKLFFDKSRRLQKKLLKFNFCLIKIKRHINKNSFFIYKRSLCIIDYFVGKRVFVHNGRIFKKFIVTKNHTGFFFGEFSFTRRYGMGVDMHKRRKKKVK